MAVRKGKKTTFSPKALVEFLLVCLALGVLISLHSKTIDIVWVLLWLGFLIAGSVVILWRLWRHPDEFKRRGMGQVAVLPRRWQKWVLGENDKDSSH